MKQLGFYISSSAFVLIGGLTRMQTLCTQKNSVKFLPAPAAFFLCV